MKQRRKERVARVALTTLGIIGAAGIIAAAAVAPGIALVVKAFAKRYPSRQRYEADRTIRGLVRRGLVKEVLHGRVIGYRLTDAGRAHLTRHELTNTRPAIPGKWDRKWRIIIFDIPERRRHLRDDLRRHLMRLGLSPLQKSVWLSPHPCQDLVRLLKVDLDLGRSVQYFTVGAFEDRQEEKNWRFRFDV